MPVLADQEGGPAAGGAIEVPAMRELGVGPGVVVAVGILRVGNAVLVGIDEAVAFDVIGERVAVVGEPNREANPGKPSVWMLLSGTYSCWLVWSIRNA